VFVCTVINQNLQIKERFERAEHQKKIAERQREVAEQKRAVAEQVTTLISDIFQSANPYGQDKEGQISVETILENGVRNVRNQANLSSAVEYKLLIALSLAYEGVGELGKAREINDLVLQRPDFPNLLLNVKAHNNESIIARADSNTPQALQICPARD
jgi:hypothetical protein